jgi:hypothetical protein
MLSLRAILWIDCIAGVTVGCAVLILATGDCFSSLTGLPDWLAIFMGLANLLYAAFSFSIVIAARYRALTVRLLVLANATWSVTCIFMVCIFFSTATILGLSYLLAEAIFVGCLAYLEWKASLHRPA